MFTQYHKDITEIALKSFFSPAALDEVVKANLRQDLPQGQVGHPEYHFDDSEFVRTHEYLRKLRDEVLSSLEANRSADARSAFGKITHASQDFYAHSTYIRLWSQHIQHDHKDISSTEILLPALIADPSLISGRFYAPWEWITFFPVIGKMLAPMFPSDSHAKINLDTPRSGPLFKQAFQAAVFRTEYEYNQIITEIANIHPQALSDFTGLQRG